MATNSAAPSLAYQSRGLKLGSGLMLLGAVAFIGYAVLFFIRNFTGSFLELGIGPRQVNVGRTQIEQFSPQLYHYISHLHLAVSGFLAATGLAVAIPSHYPYGLATVGHLGLIYLATAVFVVGAAIALKPVLDAGRGNAR